MDSLSRHAGYTNQMDPNGNPDKKVNMMQNHGLSGFSIFELHLLSINTFLAFLKASMASGNLPDSASPVPIMESTLA